MTAEEAGYVLVHPVLDTLKLDIGSDDHVISCANVVWDGKLLELSLVYLHRKGSQRQMWDYVGILKRISRS